MRLQSPWHPRLAEGAESPCDRLVSALSEDIGIGRLEVGARLPAHRDLAWKLGIGLGTVTKAYGILERRGLVRSVTGRGTFVAVTESRTGDVIDLSRNAPPSAVSERLIARSLTAIAKRVDADVFNAYPPVIGHIRFRSELARWFRRLGMDADPAHLLLTNGAQHALAVSLSTLCGPAGTLFVEQQTYPGIIGLARHLGVTLSPVAMDQEGMLPEALDRELTTQQLRPAAVYLTPTMQNPTTGSMSKSRREAIAKVCRRHDIVVIEDDVYALRPDPDYPPIATLAPDRVFYINSLSKTLNPALRIGGLVVPAAWFARAEAALHASGLMISPLSCSVMEQWLLDGTADAVSVAIQEEARRRRIVAAELLGAAMHHPAHIGYHVWLPLSPADAEAVDAATKALGILVTPPSSTSVGGISAGIRLCIGAPPRADLEKALGAIKSIIARIAARSDDTSSALR
ncbi:PLP-dependent aminotransferase family protein [Rhodopseudomonas palustris]|uniref:PLP-dependent aminotransferase family protein n=1 Tax=Rhodopseudomonas palustris TaxID=1076 RepID=A0A323UGA1_RHOPL|nr:PLP-dependent aminotransferase family protein [Rhodopseudomonas palustris]PZA11267.1 PLP-dependent aminotransferase family protein [Rhodopseudomonas palustris]